MIPTIYSAFSAIAGFAYLYFLLKAHFRIVKIDKEVEVPRSRFGEIRVSDLKLIRTMVTNTDLFEDSKIAIANLQISNFIAIVYLVLAVAIKFFLTDVSF